MSEIRVGETFANRYEVLGELSRGGMGALYRVRHLLTGREEALKVILVDRQVDDSYSRRFMVEVKAVARLRNPHTVTLFDCGHTEDGRLYYTMELLDGAPLDQLLAQQGRMDWQSVVRFGIQACESLEEAHKEGILHRDLKPGNLFIVRSSDGDESLKVLDFGIARLLSDSASLAETLPGVVVGTPLYMSPEQAAGRVLDFSSDIYSLGVVLYEMLTGRRPFDASTRAELEGKLQTEMPPSFVTVAPDLDILGGLESVVLSCLAKLPGDRPQTGAKLRAVLEGLKEEPGYAAYLSPARELDIAEVPPSWWETTVHSVIEGQDLRNIVEGSGRSVVAASQSFSDNAAPPGARRRRTLSVMSMFLVTVVLAALFSNLAPVHRLNELADGWRRSLSLVSSPGRAVVVQLGQEEDLLTLRANGEPVPGDAGPATWRLVDARLALALSEAGAGVVAFDKYYGHDHREESMLLAEAISAAAERGVPVALGALHRPPPQTLVDAGAYVGVVHALSSGFDGSLKSLMTGASLLDGSEAPSLFLLAWCLEREPPVKLGEVSDALADCLAGQKDGGKDFKLVFSEHGVKTLRASDVLTWPVETLAEKVRGKVVIIGHFERGLDDVEVPDVTVFGNAGQPSKGSLLLAAACDQLDRNQRRVPVPGWLAWLCAIALAATPLGLLRRHQLNVLVGVMVVTIFAPASLSLWLPLDFPWGSVLVWTVLPISSLLFLPRLMRA